MLFWRRWRRPCRDLTGPATLHLTRSGAYTAPTWHDQPTHPVSTVGQLTPGQAGGYTAHVQAGGCTANGRVAHPGTGAPR